VEAPWAQAAAGGSESAQVWAAAHPGVGGWPRVTCAWNQTATATGRLSSSAPNLQARQLLHGCVLVEVTCGSRERIRVGLLDMSLDRQGIHRLLLK